jgi:CRP/FNR family transcriptional regulator, nitrogen fixation regulation protein
MLSQPMIKRPASLQARSLTGPIEMIGAIIPFARNSEVYGVNERAVYLYKVLTGSVRTYNVSEDGRRQISAFYLPGDVFGFEVGDEHTLSAEAIVDCQLLVIRRTSVAALATRDSSVARQLWAMTAAELRRAQDHIMLLIKTAQERVAWFLLEMSRRLSSGDEIKLPMSRQDIADYLGLTIETVSRALTQLENASAIALPSARHIVLCNRKALSSLNS